MGATDGLREALQELAQRAGVPMEDRWLQAFATHWDLLVQWNRTHNLTRITGPREAAARHYLDCLVPLLTLRTPPEFVDVGSGAGFPGIVAAVLWPEARAVLVEPARKRASFLSIAGRACGLSRVEVREPRSAAELRSARVLSRATFSGGNRGELLQYVKPPGEILAWSTPHELGTWQEEVGTWRGRGAAATLRAEPYRIPTLEERILVTIHVASLEERGR